MEKKYLEGEKFEKINFYENPLATGDYENCHFVHCALSNTDLSGCNFIDCIFTDCNMGMAILKKTTLNNIRFEACRLTGLHFEDCNPFSFIVNFSHCRLHLASFYQQKLKKTHFLHCLLPEVDFTGADLTGAVFDHCDLDRAVFENTLLEKADFRTAYNYSINPEINRMKKAQFSLGGVAGLLHKYDIQIEQ